MALRSVDDVKQKISPCYKHRTSITDADMLCGLKSAQRQNQHRICVTPILHRKPRTSVRGYPYLILHYAVKLLLFCGVRAGDGSAVATTTDTVCSRGASGLVCRFPDPT